MTANIGLTALSPVQRTADCGPTGFRTEDTSRAARKGYRVIARGSLRCEVSEDKFLLSAAGWAGRGTQSQHRVHSAQALIAIVTIG